MSDATSEHEAMDETAAAPRPRRRRSPLVDAVVSALGIYLLVTMWGDFRYWLRSAEPTDLKTAAALMEEGLPDDLDESYVVLRGTPDIQHAARLKADERVTSYLRIVEGGGSLFAAVDRTENSEPNQFEGVYAGRMRRLGKLRMYPWIESFFNAEAIVYSREATADALMAALAGRSGAGLTLTDVDAKTFRVADDERLSVAVELPDVQLQLGRSSFTSRRAAEAAVADLGVPYFAPEEQKNNSFYKFYARVPATQRAATERRLIEGLELPERPDASYGAAVLPTSATYFLPASALAGEGDALVVTYGDSTTSRGYEVKDGALVERALDEDGALRFPKASIRSVRFERDVHVDPNGYLITVGETPSTQWMAPIMWGTVLMVVGWNLLSLAWWWRRRQG
ncbi:MAG: hypothetical protein R3A79_01965 [Nannocystaceae bacterium]